MKRIIVLVLAFCMTVSLCACGGAESSGQNGDGTEKLITVGFAQVGHESAWREASTVSARKVYTAENGYELKFVDCDNDFDLQLETVRGFIEEKVDYIIIDPIVVNGWKDILAECEAAEIPVIVVDRSIDDSDKFAAFLGFDPYTEGLKAGEWLCAYAAAKGIENIGITVIEGTSGSSSQIGRSEGFQEIASREGWNILASRSGDFTEEGGEQVMNGFCNEFAGQFNVVVCHNDEEAFGAIRALDQAGISYGVNGDVIIIAFDAGREALKMVLEGKINVDVECNPILHSEVDKVIKAMEAGESYEKQTFVSETWFTAEDTVPSITVNGQAYPASVVTEELIASRPY